MVKKKEKKQDTEGEMDFGDLDEMDSSDLDFGDLDEVDADRNPEKAGIAKEMAEEAGKGFMDSLIKKTAERSLNPEYAENYNEVMDYADFAKNTFVENKSKVEKSVYRLGKEVKKILPFQINLLNKFIEKYETDNEKFQQESEESLRENSIQSNLTSIFDKQLEVQKAFEANRQAQDQVEAKERITTTKLNVDLLSSIDNNLSTQTAFTMQISKEYYRKSLELQFKSYFIQADTLKTLKDYYKAFSLQFDSIVKNTGLPEFVKLNSTEALKQIARNQLVENTYKKMFSNSKYLEGVKKKASAFIGDKVSSVTSPLDSATDMLEMVNSAGEGSGSSILPGILSGLLGSTLGEKLAGKISPKIKDKIKDSKAINAGASALGTLSSSPASLFGYFKDKINKKKDEYVDEGDPTRWLASKTLGGLSSFMNVTDPDKEVSEVKDASILSHNKPAIFDNKVHRSITEVIPMYLSKILKENSDLTKMYGDINAAKIETGRSNSKELVYDYEGRGLVTGEKLVSNTEAKIASKLSGKYKTDSASNSILASSIQKLSQDPTANKKDINLLKSKNTDKLLKSYLEQANKKSSIKFDYDTLIANATEENAPQELKEILSNNPELSKILGLLKKSTNEANKGNLNSRLTDVKIRYPVFGVTELFKGVSKLAGITVINVLTPEQAQIIAKGFTFYITNTGKNVSIDSLLSGEVFLQMAKSDAEQVKDQLGVLVHEISIISNSGNYLQEVNLVALLGLVNESLRGAFELDPEVFQTLREYSPLLGDKGVLNAENLIEGRLTRTKDSEPVDKETIRSIVRTNRIQADTTRNTTATNNIVNSLMSSVTGARDRIMEAKNPLEAARLVLKEVKDASSAVKKKARESYAAASSSMDDLTKNLNQLGRNLSVEIFKKIVDANAKAIASVDNIIKTETEAQAKELASLEETKAKLAETFNDNRTLGEIDKSINSIKRQYKITIGSAQELKKILVTQQSLLKEINEDNAKSMYDKINKIRKTMKKTLTKVKELLDSTRRQEEGNT